VTLGGVPFQTPRVISKLPLVAATIIGKDERTPTALHHAFCCVLKAAIHISSDQIDALILQLSNNNVDVVAYTSTAYAVKILVLFPLAPEDTKIDFERIAAAFNHEMDEEAHLRT
jgi:hypothetical protein